MPERYIYFLKSESHLLLAVSLFESRRKDKILNYDRAYVKLMTSCFMECDTIVSNEASYQAVRLNSKTVSSVDNPN